MYSLVTDRFGSHVMRKLMCVLAGWDMLPSQPKSGSNSKVVHTLALPLQCCA